MLSSNPIALLIALAPLCTAWTVPAYMDLEWPPRWTAAPGDRYMYKAGDSINVGSITSCLNQPIPHNVTRSRFPVQSGRAIFTLTNKTNLRSGDFDQFTIDLYLGHLYYGPNIKPMGGYYNTGVQRTYQKSKNMWRYQNGWQNFASGQRCNLALDMTQMVVDKDEKVLSASQLVGLNVTLAFEIQDFRTEQGRGYYPWYEQVDECAYVTLTDDDFDMPSTGPDCNSFANVKQHSASPLSMPSTWTILAASIPFLASLTFAIPKYFK